MGFDGLSEVNVTTVQKCFKNSGFVFEEPEEEDERPFDNLEAFVSTAKQLRIIAEDVTVNHLVGFDDDLYFISKERDVNGLINEDISESRPEVIQIEDNSNDSEEAEEEDIENTEECPTYSEVSVMVKKLKAFAAEKEPNLMRDIINLEDKFAQCQVEKLLSRKQTKIVDYFKSTCKQVL